MMDFSIFFDKMRAALGQIGDRFAHKTSSAIEKMNHGNFDQWTAIIDNLPAVNTSSIDLCSPSIRIGSANDLTEIDRNTLKSQLLQLHPWRKGPFEVFGVYIDTEWRSDMKWQRVEANISPLKGRRLLDVGCGNGYYCLRAAGCGAKIVVGIDPFLLYVMQFQAINKYLRIDNAAVLPLGVEDIPAGCGCFDTVFSMGVLYHRREPLEHLSSLYGFLADGGELILETLVIESNKPKAISPLPRYGKMRNVWQIPSPPLLIQWLQQAGFKNAKVVDIAKTTMQEQRKTQWMSFESLEDFLDPKDPNKTIEGYPAPVRAVVTTQK